MCRYHPQLLPRWHQDDRGRQNASRGFHVDVAPGAYRGIEVWHGRDFWVDVVVPTVLELGREVLRKHRVGFGFMLQWAAVKSSYAHARTGRGCVVRPKTLAGVLACDQRKVKRANQVARELGLEVVVMTGRMLTHEEAMDCRRRGSYQRGLATVVALTIPAIHRAKIAASRPVPAAAESRRSVDSATPPKRSVKYPQKETRENSSLRLRRQDGRRSAPTHRQGGTSPTLQLANGLKRLVPWLRNESPRRMLGAIAPFAHSPLPWTADDLRLALGAQASRTDAGAHITPGAARIPWALLRHVLAQIDPYADHPRLPELEQVVWDSATAPSSCEDPDCDGHGWHNTPSGARRCPHRS